MLIFVGSLLWWQQDAAGGNKNGGSKKNRQKKWVFFILKIPWIYQRWGAGIKIQIWLFEKLAAWIPVGFETRVNDGTC